MGASAAMRVVREQIARCAPAPSNVLITGESGTGKELVARAVHAASPRRHRPLVPVNCGAIPDSLLESQLFGHVRGAFTSAVQANPGLFVAAHGGTLFLDEIAELPVPLQAKLLRVIEEKQVWAVGATRPQPVDVRIIASTNRDLAAEVDAGRFRADLFYRLKVVHVTLPAAPRAPGRHPAPRGPFHPAAQPQAAPPRSRASSPRPSTRWCATDWKGNVRELEHVLEQAMILGDGDLLAFRHLADDLAAASPRPAPADLREAVRLFARSHVLDVLARVRFNKRDAARILGISLASLYRKLNIEPPDGAVDDED